MQTDIWKACYAWPVQQGNMECRCMCVHVIVWVCGCGCFVLCTLQVPMQPTGLSGRPLNPSFLLMAKKRYACREIHTRTNINSKPNITGAHAQSLCEPFCCHSLRCHSVVRHIPVMALLFLWDYKYPIWFEMSCGRKPFHSTKKERVHHRDVPPRRFCCRKS